MSNTKRHLLCLLALALAGLCTACNPRYCEGNPGNNCLNEWDAATDGVSRCTSNDQCAAPTPVCDVAGTQTCVECTPDQADACTGTTPVCGGDHTCGPCTEHAQCAASNACLPDGSCADAGQVAYVDPAGTDNNACTKDMPCTKVAKALATNRPYVKFHGTTNEAVTVNGGRSVTFLADEGAALTRSSGSGAIVTVSDDGTELMVYDLAIQNAPNTASGIGVVIPTASGAPSVALVRVKVSNNPGGGISSSGGTLTVSQSTISGNQGGGISVTGAGAMFLITNNFIYRNGNNSTAGFGGVDIGVTSPGASRLEFNTIVDNQATSGPLNAGGVRCSATSFAAPNNIIARNLVGASTMDSNAQTLGACTYPTSTVASSVSGLAFARPDAMPYDYHLMSGSSAIDQATTGSTVDKDFDGDARPKGAQKDIGADEYAP
jgi:hypothetical protein